MFILVSEYQITSSKRYFQASCQISFMSFTDEVVVSGLRLIITGRNGKFLGWHGETYENTIFFIIQLKIYWMVEGVGK